MLIDANVFMYAAGAEHPFKGPSAAFLEATASGRVEALIDAEVLQEILHRYRAIGRWEAGRRVYDLARQIVPSVIPVTKEILDEARQLMDEYSWLVARDALHAAASRQASEGTICSYDRAFDGVSGLKRVTPDQALA